MSITGMLNNKKTKIVLYCLLIIPLLIHSFLKVYKTNIYLFVFEFIFALILLFIVIKNKKTKLENLFLLIGIPLGIIYILSIPFCKVPDEDAHFARAYAISEGHLMSSIDTEGKAYINMPSMSKVCNINTYKEYNKSLNGNNKNENAIHSNTALYSFIIYLPQTLGIMISKLFSFSMSATIYLSRLFNLICYLTLIYFSIKLIQHFKEFIFLIALNPLALQEGASLAVDAITISISIFLISYIFYLYSAKKTELLSKKEYIILLISSIICSLSKIVYVPLCLLPILLPKEKFKSKKDRIIKILLLVLIPIIINLIWLKLASRYLIVFQPGVDTPNQVKYILSHPFNYILIMFRTIIANGRDYLEVLFGEHLNNLDVHTGRLYPYLSMLITFILLIMYRYSKKTSEVKKRLVYFSLFIIIIVLIFTSLYVQWTSLKAEMIDGVQGRYFLPIMLLLPFIFLRSKANKRNLNIDMAFFQKLLLTFLIFQNLNAIITIIIAYI